MTLHQEAMQAEVDYRREQARRSWPTRSSRTTSQTITGLWRTVTQWARRHTTGAPQPAQSAPHTAAAPAAGTVRVHITCWSEDSAIARHVARTAREALAQHLGTPAEEASVQTLAR